MHASAHYGAVSRTARRGMRDKAWEWRREITFHGPHARLRPGPFFSSLGDPDPHTFAFKTLDPRTSSCALAPPHKSSNRRSSHTQNLDDCSNRNTMKPTARRLQRCSPWFEVSPEASPRPPRPRHQWPARAAAPARSAFRKGPKITKDPLGPRVEPRGRDYTFYVFGPYTLHPTRRV